MQNLQDSKHIDSNILDFKRMDSKNVESADFKNIESKNIESNDIKSKNTESKSPKISTNLAWAMVLLGGMIECFWVSGLKYSSNFLEYSLTALGIAASFCCMILALKRIEVSVCYAVFVGIGTAGVVVGEMAFFDERFSSLKVGLIAILIAGVIGLKLVSKERENADTSVLADTLEKDFGLDEIEQKLAQIDSKNTDSIESKNAACERKNGGQK